MYTLNDNYRHFYHWKPLHFTEKSTTHVNIALIVADGNGQIHILKNKHDFVLLMSVASSQYHAFLCYLYKNTRLREVNNLRKPYKNMF